MIRNDHSDADVVFLQLQLGGDRNFSYLLGDRSSAEAAVVDPGFAPERIAAIARDEKLVIKHVLLTHGHGDHMGGLARLVKLSGARAHAGKQELVPGTEPLYDGDHFNLGQRRILCFFTPGHAPGHFCFLFEGRLLTGDLLFCGKVGGTGPFFAGSSPEAEWESLHRIMTLPEDTLVFAGHDYYGGKGQMPHSTIGHERAHNPFLSCEDFDAFCRLKENWAAYKKEHGIR